MKNIGKLAAGTVVLAVIGVSAYLVLNRGGNNLTGIDISGTNCDQIAAARAAVDNEFATRQQAAQDQLAAEREKASDDFWTANRRLEDAHHACLSAAALSDPCKDLFEQASQLYDQIMAQFDAGNGFNEDKFNEREQVKKDYDACVKRAENDEFYKADTAKCDADLAAGQATNQQTRQAAEAAAQAKYDAAMALAEGEKTAKHAILDEIEKKCHEPIGNTNVNAGGLTTGGTGTVVKSSSPACTGVFEGNDPELRQRLNDLQNQLDKARAAGLRAGLYGSDHLQEAVDNARQELKDSERSCETDADCGDPTPVCCSNTQVGRVYCDAGVCAAEQTDCEEGEICTGTPAQCVAPSTGLTSEPVVISGQVVIGQPCNNRLRIINLQKKSEESDRFEIVGNVPSWLSFSAVGGKLPQDVTVLIDCSALQGMGPGVYTAEASITVYSAANELINTIPLNVTITVVAPVEENNTAGTVGGGGEVSEPTEPTESAEPVSVGPANVEFVYNHAQPQCPLPIPSINISGPEGSTWTLVTPLPIWLSAPNGTSGSVPGTLNLQFPCQLNEYKDQEQEITLQFKVVTHDGVEHTAGVHVGGSFINFSE